MVDDTILEARKNARHNGEEDPLVVAQRFLNIYRQIHIFSPDKKESFNNMVLELSPEIRGMFGQLPGGILLQEYVDELAEQRGIEKSVYSSAGVQNLEEADSKQAKILATALAQAQVQASAQMQAMEMSPSNSNAANLSIHPASASLSIDKDFAKEFAVVLGDVLQQNTNTQYDEIKSIASAFSQNHMNFLKTIQTENQAHREEMKKISMAMFQIQQKAANLAQATTLQNQQAADHSSKQLIQMFLSSQRQVLEKIAQLEVKSQNADIQNNHSTSMLQKSEQRFEKIVSLLYNSQKNAYLEISKLINDNQQSLLKLMMQNNNLNQNSGNASASNNIQINSSDYSAVLNSIAEKLGALSMPTANVEIKFPKHAFGDLIEAQSKLYREIAKDQTKELSFVIAEAFKESQKASTQSIINALKSHQQPIVMSQTEIMPSSDSLEFSRDDKDNNYTSDDIVFDQQAATITADETPALEQKKKKKKKKKKKATEQELSNIDTNNDFFDMQGSNDFFVQTDNYSDDNNTSTSEVDFFATDNGEKSDNVSQQPDIMEETYAEKILDTNTNQDIIIGTELLSEEPNNETDISDFNFFDDVVSDIENTASNNNELFGEVNSIDTANDWGFSSYEKSKSFGTLEQLEACSDEAPNDWGFSSEIPENTETDEGKEGVDWKWEYVEDEQSSECQDDKNTLQPLYTNSMLCTGEIIFDSNTINYAYEAKSSLGENITFQCCSISDNFVSEEEAKDPYLK